jgi:hypothetical protein
MPATALTHKITLKPYCQTLPPHHANAMSSMVSNATAAYLMTHRLFNSNLLVPQLKPNKNADAPMLLALMVGHTSVVAQTFKITSP